MTESRDDGRRRDDETRHPEQGLDPDGGRPAGRQVILLVEDDEADRDMYGGLLWYNGFDVVHVEDGPAAVTQALATDPDLILLDIMLPGDMDGIEVARTLRRRGVTAPIVALSAHSRAEYGRRAAAAGVDGYLEKPIGPFAVVQEAMRRIGQPRPAGPDS